MSLNYVDTLVQHRKAGLYRERRILRSSIDMQRGYNGKVFLSFCSNDYLGLSRHPTVIKAMQQATDVYGVGSGSSHFLGGFSRAHHELEQALAAFLNYPKVLVFSTGYMANMGILAGLLHRKAAVFADKLSHASLIDGAKLSGASFKRYLHNNLPSLERRLTQATARHKFIVTDGVFSMDGDLALLPDLVEKAKKYSTTLLVDDAHGLGVLGKKGGGVSDYFGLKPDIISGGFGKSFGCFGGFAAADESTIEHLIQFSRLYMYTTALPPAIAKATHTSLILLQKEYWRREKLQSLITYFRKVAQQLDLPILPSQTPIQPLLVGNTEQTLALAEFLLQNGFLVNAIRPPTVPRNTSRLRISLSALHSENEINRLLEKIAVGLKLQKINDKSIR